MNDRDAQIFPFIIIYKEPEILFQKNFCFIRDRYFLNKIITRIFFIVEIKSSWSHRAVVLNKIENKTNEECKQWSYLWLNHSIL